MRTKYTFHEDDEGYDDLIDALPIRQQNKRLEQAASVQDYRPGRLRRVIGWSLYWTYVVLQFLVNLIHDIAIVIRDGRAAVNFKIN